MIIDNVKVVLENIEKACLKAKRNISEVTLIAVSKTKSVSDIKEVYDFGIRDFGENKVQELVSKKSEVPSDLIFHMIGHLQSNKVKDIIDKVSLIHSVDSLKLVGVINKEAIKKNINVSILLEINIANEESKYGFKIEEIDEVIKQLPQYSNVTLKGLMCVAPYDINPENNRKYFKEMRLLKDKYNLEILSMGMSNDYMIAIEEGATHVRVGTSIFGERNYN